MPKTKIRAVIASPLLHFLVLGGLIFGVYNLMNPPGEQPHDNVLRLSENDAQRLALDFVTTRHRAPNPEELSLLIRDWAIEEISVREALALGLDQGDAMIRNRLRNKIEFLAEAPAAALTPDEATLEGFYQANTARFGQDDRLSFDQLLLPAGASPADIAALKAKLAGGADPGSLGASTMLPATVDAMPIQAVERVFGKDFGAEVAAAPTGEWFGPVESGFGAHLVRLEKREAGVLPPLATQRERVLAEWRANEARKMRDAYVQSLLARYRLELPTLDGSVPPEAQP